ncbi:MAG: transcriptional regulator NrdR [Nanoarchaeota archaeon]|nr:transcriptional regulator NrdR [Nanoarchaeota archaeon]
MKCQYCSHPDTKVVDSRETDDLSAIRRRRECLKCSKRFTTHERATNADIVVIKKDGAREQYDRQKVLLGIRKACEKRDIKDEVIEQIADEVEARVRNHRSTEVPSLVIGRKVMAGLKKVDNVSYLRFASVYQEFEDISSFERELKTLKNPKKPPKASGPTRRFH